MKVSRSFTFDEELLKDLNKISRDERKSSSRIVNEALTQYINTKKGVKNEN